MLTRVFDLLLSLSALLFFLPIFIPLAALLRLTGEGEIFYRQRRIGKGGRQFNVLKFATMLKDSPSMDGGTITSKDDPRVLPLGRLLRKTKINELPQLLNVALGHMSLVGPRPLTRETFSEYDTNAQEIILSVRPGLSGVGSIFFRDEEKFFKFGASSKDVYKVHIAPYKALLEQWFVKNQGVVTYFLLICLTIYYVLRPKSNMLFRLLPTLPPPPPFFK